MFISFSQLGEQGRMGNQMFQIATVIGTAKKYNCDYLFPDIIPHNEALTGKLLGYNYNAYWFENISEKTTLKTLIDENIKFRHQCTSTLYQEIPIYTGFNDDDILDLSGYYQSFKYFENAEQEVRNVFSLKNYDETDYLNNIRNKHQKENIIAIGLRLTDYLETQNFYYNLSNTNYYEKAIKQYDKNTIFLVMSDDIEKAKKIIKSKNINRIFEYQEKKPLDGFAAMAQCDGYICANSTFHLWATYLGNYDYSKKVIVPKNWYVQPQYDSKDLYLDKWIKI